MITGAGIELISGISGQVDEVVQAFLGDKLFDTRFTMPGRPNYQSRGPGKGYGRARRRRRGMYFPQHEIERR
jgi:hypothetical protein